MGLNKKEKTGKLFWGRKIILNTDDLDASLLIHSGLLYSKSEYSLTKFFIKYLKENDIFYDIGANCGFYSHLAIEFCQEVHAFEPLSDVFTYLYKNLSKENNIFLNNLALSDNSASDFLYIRKNQSGVSTLIPDNPKSEIYIKTKVETDTLDRYSIKHKKPTIIKLDVEGAENLVLEGGIDTIKKYKPTIAMEVRGGERGRNISQKAVKIIKACGYTNIYRIDEKGDKEGISCIDFSRINDSDNFIFKKE